MVLYVVEMIMSMHEIVTGIILKQKNVHQSRLVQRVASHVLIQISVIASDLYENFFQFPI